MSTASLFSVPILSEPFKKSVEPSGAFVCTSPVTNVYVLTFTSPPDNRLTTAFLQSFLLALDIIEQSYPPGVVITTSSIQKFYSNGLDLEHARTTKGFWKDSLYAVFKRLITYPMPTIACVNGHAFAGGLMLAMYHDYRIFNPSRGFLCLNELDFGVPLQSAMSIIFKQKVPALTYRSLVLEAKRFGGQEALAAGIVDVLGGLEEAIGLVKERKLTEKGKSGIYNLMKSEMYKETIATLDGFDEEEKKEQKVVKVDEERKHVMKKRVAEWERNNKGAIAKL